MSYEDLTGKTFNNFYVIEEVEKPVNGKSKGHYWRVQCLLCKRTDYVQASGEIKKKNGFSCGCTSANKRHGMSDTSIHNIWLAMLNRCRLDIKQNSRYYGRGIKVCERWHTFETFYSDMGDRPSDKHSLERENNDGNYEPGNVKWATVLTQANNRSRNRQ
jgi:hypothetical protein